MDPREDHFEIERGTAGASARAEYARRRANRERRAREEHPRIGGLVFALQGDPAHERAWARGAVGEEAVARALAKHCGDEVVVLHDRRIPGRRGNIDHIAIAASGVWVIDSKRYTGKIAIEKPLFGQPKLTIAGRDKTKLVDGLGGQVASVEEVMAAVRPGTLVRGALCFVEGELPTFGTLSFNGYPLLYPRRLAKRLRAAGPVTPEEVESVAAGLAERFPSA